MVVFSVLRQSASKNLQTLFVKGCVLKPLTQKNASRFVLSRSMSEVRKMTPIPSKIEWEIFKDQAHLYVLIGVLPLAAVIFYTNVFVGQAELADIPEDYEPKHWEYHKHPIKRWFARYIYPHPQKEYERFMHVLYVEDELRKNRLLEWKVNEMMGERQDYKGWYWVPVDASRVERAVKSREHLKDVIGAN